MPRKGCYDPVKNKISCRAYYAAHREENKISCAAYRAAHREEIKAKRKVWYKNHREEQRAKRKVWRENHRQEIRVSRKAYDASHKEEKKAQELKRLYGLTPQEFNELLTQQGGTCAICKSSDWNGRGPVVDHDHTIGQIRGLLCHACNTA